MNPLFPTSSSLTLDEVRHRKAKALQLVRQQKTVISRTAGQLLAPLAPPENKMEKLMRTFNLGMAAFDGIKLGLKAMRQIRASLRQPTSQR